MPLRPLIFLPIPPETIVGRGSQSGYTPSRPGRTPTRHAEYLLKKFDEAVQKNDSESQARNVHALPAKEGIYLNIRSVPNFELPLDKLEAPNNGYRLLIANSSNEENGKVVSAIVYLTDNGKQTFVNKIREYASELTNYGNPKNAALIELCEDINLAVIKDFWTDDPAEMPHTEPKWCEVWLRNNNDPGCVQRFFDTASALDIECLHSNVLNFPERTVVLAKLNQEMFCNILSSYDEIAEWRLNREPATFFTGMPIYEQAEWIKEFLNIAAFPKNPSVAVCILDTGVNNGHPLLKSILADSDLHTFDPEWDPHDHNGHGTNMSGIAAYGNLSETLAAHQFELKHCLESGKIFAHGNAIPPELYGLATLHTFQSARDAAPERTHIACMAIGCDSPFANRGEPTSWSAALDALSSGMGNDEKQLVIISMGNVDIAKHSEYPESNKMCMPDDPAQSWNAITVGAYTEFDQLSKELQSYSPVAPKFGLSPFSATSLQWTSEWPAKPDIVFEGGNTAINSMGFITEDDGMSILTTSASFQKRLFESFNQTSAATAMCANFAAKLQASYPELWPESVRGLIVHSAKWTNKMLEQFGGDGSKTALGVLRHICGYGVPSLERAMWCLKNRMVLVAQNVLQPYIKENGHDRMQIHLYDLPWPMEVLQNLGATSVTLRVTLSYFIEPSPGQRGWKSKFRYASHGLRFDLCGSQEGKEEFISRVTNIADGVENGQIGRGSNLSARWKIGSNGRSAGSIHSDFIKTTAANLATCNQLAVFPVIGWWRERKHLQKSNSEARYSLIVSLTTDEQTVDLYAPVINQIASRVQQHITII